MLRFAQMTTFALICALHHLPAPLDRWVLSVDVLFVTSQNAIKTAQHALQFWSNLAVMSQHDSFSIKCVQDVLVGAENPDCVHMSCRNVHTQNLSTSRLQSTMILCLQTTPSLSPAAHFSRPPLL